MRNISTAGLAKLAQHHGNEPIAIVEIDWVDGKTTAYADRTVGSIPGRIIELSALTPGIKKFSLGIRQENAVIECRVDHEWFRRQSAFGD